MIETYTMKQLFNLLSSKTDHGRTLTDIDYLSYFRRLMELSPIPTTEPLLPLLLRFKGQPLTMRDHFPLSPIFYTNKPPVTILMNGRQTGKSVGVAATLDMNSIFIPNLSSLYVTPLQEQMRRFSLNYMRELIENSPFRAYFTKGATQTITQRSFTNDSKIFFSFASTTADRVRGINADLNCYDEIQDFDYSILPVIAETLSASAFPMKFFTGTPKTEDNTLTHLWRNSSMAEWWIHCNRCGVDNIPSKDYHLEKMIGPYREDISEKEPAVICYKCGKPINPRQGRWVHRFPDRRMDPQYGTGYHCPQIIFPMHYSNPLKWQVLLAKKENLPEATFWNEVLGEPMDAGQTFISTRDLVAAGCLGYRNNPVEPDSKVFEKLRSGKYQNTILAADWGGGGKDLISFTTLALMGIDYDGGVDVLWGKRFSSGIDHDGEANAVLYWMNMFHPDLVVHDNTGAGALRETILVQKGVPVSMIMAINYVPAASGPLIRQINATVQNPRTHYNVDKTRSLQYCMMSIKNGLLRFFEYDGGEKAINAAGTSSSLMDDFLALIEEKMTSQGSNERYIIRRIPSKPDDFAQTVNIGCVALWYISGKYPNFTYNGILSNQDFATVLDSVSQI